MQAVDWEGAEAARAWGSASFVASSKQVSPSHLGSKLFSHTVVAATYLIVSTIAG